MRLGKLLLAVVAAVVFLGAFVSSASARNISLSEQRVSVLWNRLTLSGGFGSVECEVLLSRSFHTRTFVKSVGSLIGYITEGTVLRCARGGATINQASFPWHLRYRGFSGTLPNMTGASGTDIGSEWRLREPTFGIICTVRSTESGSLIVTYAISSGTITSSSLSTEGMRCEGMGASLSGTTTNVVNTLTSRARISVTLI